MTLQAKLRNFRDRADAAEYEVVLKEVFALFGEGVHESLERTMGKYLERTNGDKALSKLSDWEVQDSKKLLSHNNHAERPFATVKAIHKNFPSMKLSMMSAVAHAKSCGTFNEGGSYIDSCPFLKKAVDKLCCIRKYSLGAITLLLHPPNLKRISKTVAAPHYSIASVFERCSSVFFFDSTKNSTVPTY